MIRFIIKMKRKDNISGYEIEDIYSIDADIPVLEEHLTRGGFGENGYEVHSLLGVEILQEDK